MNELVVISGKGGTGKTSIAASLSSLFKRKVMADCDVDAADLFIILKPTIEVSSPFTGGKKAMINQNRCSRCGACAKICRFDAITKELLSINSRIPTYKYQIDPISCEGCGVCAYICPGKAITLEDVVNGECMLSKTKYGPFVHGKLYPGEENSGKLVASIKNRAKEVANDQKLGLVIIDGPPGIGCPVISSISGAHLVLVVAEPTPSGIHDALRAFNLTRNFNVRTSLCVNRYDINKEMSEKLQKEAVRFGVDVLQSLRYDPAMTRAQYEGMPVVEYTQSGVTEDILKLKGSLERLLQWV